MQQPCVLWYASYQWGLTTSEHTLLFDTFDQVVHTGLFFLFRASFQNTVHYVVIFRDQLEEHAARQLMWALWESRHSG
jgi:hypothetical protein